MNTTLRKTFIRGGETKVMKKTLSSLLVFALVLTMLVPAFAFAADAKPSAEEMAKQLSHIFQGDHKGNLDLDGNMDRAAVSKVVALLLDLEVVPPAADAEPPFSDVTTGGPKWAYFDGYIDAVVKAKAMEGIGNGKFNPGGNVTYAEIATIVARLLGIDDTGTGPDWYAKNLAAVQELGFLTNINASNANDAAPRRVLVEAAWIANGVLNPPAPTEVDLKVESITQTNLAEIVVKFNGAVKEESIDLNNVKVNGESLDDLNGDDFDVSEDGKTVTFFKNGGFVSTNQKSAKISISGIAPVAGKTMPAIVDEVVHFTDVLVPYLTEVKALGNKVLTLVFSEPIKEELATGIYANYRVDNRAVAGEVAKPVEVERNTITLYLRTALTPGEHEMGFTSDTVKDYAKFVGVAQNVKFTIIEDTTKPQIVEVVSATQKRVELKFNKEVDATTAGATAYWKDSAVTKTAASLSNKPGDKTIVRVNFADHNALPLIATLLTVDKIKDFYGNTMDKAEVSVTAQADLNRPEVLSVTPEKGSEENAWIIKFSKAVYVPENTVYNIDVKNRLGNRVVLNDVNYNTDKYGNTIANELRITGSFPLSGSPYTVTVQNVEDTSYQKNKNVPQTFTVSLQDTTLPSVTSAVKTATNKIVIVFNKAVDPSSATDLANYSYKFGSGYVAFPSTADITINNNLTVVTITLPNNWKVGSTPQTPGSVTDIMVSKVQDIRGNQILNYVTTLNATPGNAASITGDATATGKKSVVLQLDNGNLPIDLFAGDFVVTYADGSATNINVVDVTLNSTSRKLTLSLDKSLNADGSYGAAKAPVYFGVVNNGQTTPVYTAQLTRDAFDQSIEGITTGMVDEISPSLVVPTSGRLAVGSPSSTIGNAVYATYLQFDENVNVSSLTAQAAFVVKNKDGKVLTVGSDYTVSAHPTDASIVVISLTPGKGYNGVLAVSLTANTQVKDTIGNVMNDFAEIWTEKEVVVPFAPSAALAKGTNNGTTKLVNVSSAMEYSLDGGNSWNPITTTSVDNVNVNVGDEIKVRVAATVNTQAGAVQTLTVTTSVIQ